MYSLAFPLMCLVLTAGEEGFTELLADEKSPPEFGYKLTKEEAAQGWIALYDGQTTFGWLGARIETVDKPMLVGGETSSRFGSGTLNLVATRGGTLTFGQERHEIKPGKMKLKVVVKGPPVAIQCDRELTLARIDYLPGDLWAIYSGENFADWQPLAYPKVKDRKVEWTTSGGIIVAKGGPGALEYRPGGKEFLAGDFLLQVDARTRAPHTNGGIFLRNQPGTVMMGYEAQIHHRVYDTRKGEGGCCTGSIDDRQHARRLVARDGEVFRLTALCSGPHISLWINGYQTADWTDTRATDDNPRRGQRVAPGTLQLQAHDPETDLEFHRVLLQKWE